MRPASVGSTPRPARTNSSVSRACSSLRICSATAGWDTRSASAAAGNEPSSSAAQKHRICCRDKSSAFELTEPRSLPWCAPEESFALGPTKQPALPREGGTADHGHMTRDVVIVGGGIAGLSAAWRLRHRNVLLLEAGDRLGGRRGPHGKAPASSPHAPPSFLPR